MVDPEIRSALAELADRVARLEAAVAHPPAAAPRAAVDPADALWAVTGLRERLERGDEPDGGVVMLLGDVTLPTGEPVTWQQGFGAADALDVDWSERADAFAALAHPVRLELLRAILNGTRSTAELAGLANLGTTGQLHHHLRPLLAAGWLRQAGRGSYEVPVQRIVPLLVLVAGAER